MSAAHVRRGGSQRAKPRKAASKVGVPKKIAKRLPVSQARANRLAAFAFLGFLLAGATMGQLLSVPMILVGGWLMLRARPAPRAVAA